MNNKTCTLIGSDKGGVGKSLIAQIMVIAHDQAARGLRVVEIDHQRKLTHVFGDRVDLSLAAGAGVGALTANHRAGETFFNDAYGHWAAGDSLTDLGANVTTPLLEWFRHCDVATLANEDSIGFRFVAVASPDDQAIRSAVAALEQARRALGVDAELFLLLNDITGGAGFSPYSTTEVWRQAMAMQTTHGVRVINVPHCNSAIMDWSRAWGLTILDVLNPKSEALDRISVAASFDRIQRHHQVRVFLDWVRAVQDAMHPLFIRARTEVLEAAE